MGSLLLLFSLICSTLVQLRNCQPMASDPTDGFIPLSLTTANFDIQRPYNEPQDERYSYVDGVHKLWAFSTDKPHSTDSHTLARTEIRIKGHDYSSGVWQFEGHGYVPEGTSGVCIMQIFGASDHASTLMLRVYKGKLMYYRKQVLVSDIYDKWFQLNVIHDVDAGKVRVFIDGEHKLEVGDRGGRSHYFKCGVYEQDRASRRMESHWKGIKVLKKQ